MPKKDYSFQDRILDIIRRSENNTGDFTSVEVAMLFHWVKHQNDAMYSFVPKRYKWKK